MLQPPSFEQLSSDSSMLDCKLHKSLYALKQARRASFENLKSFLLNNLGFRVFVGGRCLFIKSNVECFVLLLIYVDDIVITGTYDAMVSDVITSINV